MLNDSSSPDITLKSHIETEIKKDAEAQVSLDVASAMLGVKSIDREYAALRKRAARSLFQYKVGEGKGLRPYQTEALAELGRLVRMGSPTIGVQLPTGAGKTFLIHSFIYQEMLKKGRNVLVVAPSWEIANQHAATVCQQFADGAPRVRRLGGGGQLIAAFPEMKAGERGRVIITTSALYYARAEKLNAILNCGLVVIDEGHHGWKKKRLNALGDFAKAQNAPIIFLTATPPLNMQGMPFAAQLRYLDLVGEYLVRCEVVRLDTGEHFDPVLKNGMVTQKSRVELSSRRGRFEKIVGESRALMKGQTIYYAGSVAEAMGVYDEYIRLGVSAVVVHSKWASRTDKINALAIEKFRGGDVQVLVNVQMLAMGFDVPGVETIIVARPVESDTLFTQMVGRGARPAEGKDKFLLIDVHDTIFKPEVAKMFEHRHVFYAGTEKEDAALAEVPVPILPVRSPVLPLRPRMTLLETPHDYLKEARGRLDELYHILERRPALAA